MFFPNIEELKKEQFADLEKYFHKPLYDAIKRAIDFLMAIFALIILLPVLLLLALLIKFNSIGKAIFSHERVGKNGKLFRLYKFRTMYEGVKDQEIAPSSPNDQRITSIGKFLRRTSLDELPQLINILRGEMSFVGPRPEMYFIVKNYTAKESQRLRIMPGLTGLWQIMGRKDLPLHKNLEFDLYYIQHRTLLMDLLIILKTFAVVISGKGAY